MTIRVRLEGWAGKLAQWLEERRRNRERRRTAAFRRILEATVAAAVDEAADALAARRRTRWGQHSGFTGEEVVEGFRRVGRASRFRDLTEEDTRR